MHLGATGGDSTVGASLSSARDLLPTFTLSDTNVAEACPASPADLDQQL
jgi:hypothetical protein